jgi:hypothetical protein
MAGLSPDGPDEGRKRCRSDLRHTDRVVARRDEVKRKFPTGSAHLYAGRAGLSEEALGDD